MSSICSSDMIQISFMDEFITIERVEEETQREKSEKGGE